MCIWKVNEEDRHCEYCSYRGGCAMYEPPVKKIDEDFKRYYGDVCSVMGCDVLSRSRKSPLVWARNMLAYLMSREGYSTTAIGRLMGRNHSTVINSVKQVNTMLAFPAMYPNETEIWNKILSLQKQ